MTSAVEIRRWTRSIRARRADLILRDRKLLVLPISHVICGVNFPGSWDKTLPRPNWFMSLTFTPPTGTFGGKWRVPLPTGRSTDAGFLEKLNGLLEKTVDESLVPLSALQAFYDATIPPRSGSTNGGDWESLADHADHYAPVLAALGRLDEAADVAFEYVDTWEARWQKSLEDGEAMIAGYRRRTIGRDTVEFATSQLALIADLKTLAKLAGAGDTAAVASLLRDWELQKIQRWELDDVWEHQPFPLEL